MLRLFFLKCGPEVFWHVFGSDKNTAKTSFLLDAIRIATSRVWGSLHKNEEILNRKLHFLGRAYNWLLYWTSILTFYITLKISVAKICGFLFCFNVFSNVLSNVIFLMRAWKFFIRWSFITIHYTVLLWNIHTKEQ